MKPSPLIVALDFSDLEPCDKLLRKLKGLVEIYKIGSELFTAHGWRAVKLVEKFGGKVFLDLKLHDIPTTVAKTARVIAGRGVFMFDVHTLGGLEMMREAKRAVDEAVGAGLPRPFILGVTLLTSLEEKILSLELGIERPLQDQVLALAHLAKKAGLNGVISSPEEIEPLRKEFGRDFFLLTPGIRFQGADRQDQARWLSPARAIQRGADYLVVGRPITAAENPRQATETILKSIQRS